MIRHSLQASLPLNLAARYIHCTGDSVGRRQKYQQHKTAQNTNDDEKGNVRKACMSLNYRSTSRQRELQNKCALQRESVAKGARPGKCWRADHKAASITGKRYNADARQSLKRCILAALLTSTAHFSYWRSSCPDESSDVWF